MTKPMQDPGHRGESESWGRVGAIDHDNRHSKCARGGQFGIGATAAGVLGDDEGDTMIAQQGEVIGRFKRATGDDGRRKRKDRRRGWINEAQQVVVMRGGGEQRQGLATDGEEDAGGGQGQVVYRFFKALHDGPFVALLRLPDRTLKGGEGQGKGHTCGSSVMAHLRGEGMGCVDHMRDLLVGQISNQALYAAKAADPLGQGLRHGVGGATRIGKDSVDPSRGKGTGQQAGFGCAAEQKDALHG